MCLYIHYFIIIKLKYYKIFPSNLNYITYFYNLTRDILIIKNIKKKIKKNIKKKGIVELY